MVNTARRTTKANPVIRELELGTPDKTSPLCVRQGKAQTRLSVPSDCLISVFKSCSSMIDTIIISSVKSCGRQNIPFRLLLIRTMTGANNKEKGRRKIGILTGSIILFKLLKRI